VLPDHADNESLEQRFRHFHEANPWVFGALVSLTREYVERGAQRVSINMLCEVIRYQYGRTVGGDTYKLNNNHRAFYARLLMQEHPEWDGLFATRAQRSAA
jgi:hypothetical protein